MKKLFIAILTLALAAQTSFAQQAGRFRMGMDLGPAIPQEGGIGALLNLEPKVNLNNKMNIGIRFGVAGLAKDVTYYDFILSLLYNYT